MFQGKQGHVNRPKLVLIVPRMSFCCCLNKQAFTKTHSRYFWPSCCCYMRTNPNHIAVSIKIALRTYKVSRLSHFAFDRCIIPTLSTSFIPKLYQHHQCPAITVQEEPFWREICIPLFRFCSGISYEYCTKAQYLELAPLEFTQVFYWIL